MKLFLQRGLSLMIAGALVTDPCLATPLAAIAVHDGSGDAIVAQQALMSPVLFFLHQFLQPLKAASIARDAKTFLSSKQTPVAAASDRAAQVESWNDTRELTEAERLIESATGNFGRKVQAEALQAITRNPSLVASQERRFDYLWSNYGEYAPRDKPELQNAYFDALITVMRFQTEMLTARVAQETFLKAGTAPARSPIFRILMVDDELYQQRSNEQLIRRLLETDGHQVDLVIASNAEEAIELYGKDVEGFDFVLSDQSMKRDGKPSMDGSAMLERLDQIRPAASTRAAPAVCIFSGNKSLEKIKVTTRKLSFRGGFSKNGKGDVTDLTALLRAEAMRRVGQYARATQLWPDYEHIRRPTVAPVWGLHGNLHLTDLPYLMAMHKLVWDNRGSQEGGPENILIPLRRFFNMAVLNGAEQSGLYPHLDFTLARRLFALNSDPHLEDVDQWSAYANRIAAAALSGNQQALATLNELKAFEAAAIDANTEADLFGFENDVHVTWDTSHTFSQVRRAIEFSFEGSDPRLAWQWQITNEYGVSHNLAQFVGGFWAAYVTQNAKSASKYMGHLKRLYPYYAQMMEAQLHILAEEGDALATTLLAVDPVHFTSFSSFHGSLHLTLTDFLMARSAPQGSARRAALAVIANEEQELTDKTVRTAVLERAHTLAQGRTDSAIAPEGYRAAAPVDEKEFDASAAVMGDSTLSLALGRGSRRGSVARIQRRYFELIEWLRSRPEIHTLTPMQLRRIICDAIILLTGDQDPYQDVGAQAVAAMNKVNLLPRLGKTTGTVDQRVARALAFSAIAGRHSASSFLQGIEAWETGPDDERYLGLEHFERWLRALRERNMRHLLVIVEDKKNYDAIRWALVILMRDMNVKVAEGQPRLQITLAGKSRPIMNDATATWLQTDSERDLWLREWPADIRVLSTGSDVEGTDLTTTSKEFNAAFLESDAVLALGPANAETLVRNSLGIQRLTRPVLGVALNDKGAVEFTTNHHIGDARLGAIRLSFMRWMLGAAIGITLTIRIFYDATQMPLGSAVVTVLDRFPWTSRGGIVLRGDPRGTYRQSA